VASNETGVRRRHIDRARQRLCTTGPDAAPCELTGQPPLIKENAGRLCGGESCVSGSPTLLTP